MNHPVADIVRQLLVDLGIASDGGDWPAYYANMPDAPDNCMAVYDTEALDVKRGHPTGVTAMIYGIQVLVRAKDTRTAYLKTKEINRAFDEDVYRDEVTLDESVYLVQAISRMGAENPLGPEGATKRQLYSTNARVSVSLIEELGTSS